MMKKYWQVLSLLVLITFLIVIRPPLVSSQVAINSSGNVEHTLGMVQAQAPSQNEEEIAPETPEQQTTPDESNKEGAPVILDGETLFYFSSKIEGVSAKQRAQQASQEIEEVAKDYAISIDSLHIVELEAVRIISAGDEMVVALIEADAKVANLSLDVLAGEYLQKVKDAIAQYREKRSLKRRVLGILTVIFDAVIFIVLLILLNKLMDRINRRIRLWRATRLRALRIQSFQLLSVDQQASLFLGLVRIIYWVIVAFLVFLYLAALFHYFPRTRKWGDAILSIMSSVLGATGEAVVAYLPNLFTIGMTVLIIHYLNRFFRLFFRAIDRGTLSIPGFYQDWARPTEKLMVILFWALGLTIILPLLPGASSPAFQGISLFIGALFTLGGASAIANLVGGFIIIYTRAFQIGDRVKLG